MKGNNAGLRDEVTTVILRVIAATGSLAVDAVGLGDHDDLYDAGLKSLAAVRLMVALEEEFGIEFPDSVLHRSAFSTIAHIRDAVTQLVAAAPLVTPKSSLV